MKRIELTAVFVQGEHGYTAYIEEMRGVITQGSTIEEAEENLVDALELYLEPDEEADSVDEVSRQIIRKPFVQLTRSA